MRENGENNIVLVDTGNFVSDYYMSAITNHVPDYTAMNMIGYDVMGLGFNEINRDFASYNNLNKKTAFKKINCNVKTLKGKKVAEPYFIKVVNGVKVGFVSVLNENMYLALSREAKDSITIEDPIVALENVLMELVGKADVIVALTNLDYHVDLKTGAGLLASTYPDIDLIIEGSYGANKNKIFNVSGTRIYTIEKNGMYLGDVTFKVTKGKGDERNRIDIISEQFYPINVHVNGRLVSDHISEDKKLLQRLEKLTEKVENKLSVSGSNVATTNFSSIGKMDNFTKLCCIATDALRVETGADVAFLNAGLFKEVDLSKEKNLSYTFASDILKYNNNAVIVNLRGDEIKNIIEYSMIRRGYGQFLIFSGMEVEYSVKKKKVKLTVDQKKWNKMWELWVEGNAESPYAELMTYQSEINNGGHDQYFTNVENTSDLQKDMSVLESILSEKLKQNLQKAYQAYLLLEEKEDDEYAEETIEQCDNVFYENEEEINQMLKEYATRIEI